MDPKTRYCFLAEWFDLHAQIYRQYEFFFYPSDSSIEMYDTKQRKTFLRRTKADIHLSELFVGSAVNVNARQLLIRDFGDEFTRRELSKTMESTLVVVKPTGVPHVGSIIDAFYSEKFTLCRLRMKKSGSWLKQLGITDHLEGNYVVMEVLSSNVVEGAQSLINSKLESILRIQNIKTLLYTPQKDQVTSQLSLVFDNIDERTAKLKNCTVCVIRPHAVLSGVSGKIIQEIINNGYSITDMEMLHLDSANAQEFLEVYKGVVPEYHLMLGQITSGPLIALEITGGEDIVTKFREFAGPGDPELARIIRKDSLRAKFGEDKVKDAVHCTELPEDGLLEVNPPNTERIFL